MGRRGTVVLLRAYRRPAGPADPLEGRRRRPLMLWRARRARRIAQKALLGAGH